MGNLSQLQNLVTIIGAIAGGLLVVLGLIITARMSALEEKIRDKVGVQFKEMKTDVSDQFKEMKKEMHDTMITKDYFNGKFEVLSEKIQQLAAAKTKNNNG